MLIDTHSHIYLPEFDADRSVMLANAEKEGVELVLMPAIDTSAHGSLLKSEADFAGKCLAMMGLHPCSVKANFESELEAVKGYFEQRQFVAVGETGLDFYWDLAFTREQYISFQSQIELGLQYDIPIVIHSRNSTDECIK
ncbi:MAG TPA: TatD family hydrolase, partial [Chitinophagaceae bacterium]|nr:TatD family hydrolase [Chitinophagaceae bacterium]